MTNSCPYAGTPDFLAWALCSVLTHMVLPCKGGLVGWLVGMRGSGDAGGGQGDAEELEPPS